MRLSRRVVCANLAIGTRGVETGGERLWHGGQSGTVAKWQSGKVGA